MKNFPDSNQGLYNDLYRASKPFFEDLTKKLKFENISKDFFLKTVIPLSVYINFLPNQDKPYLICFTGGQGSGKTTLSNFIQLVLKQVYKRTPVGFSIDDIYKTKEERETLAKTIHPLCRVRGVPGTHDIQMGLHTLDSLFQAKPSTLTAIPAFSKPLDQHLPRDQWQIFKGKPDYIFFDAWCGGAKPIDEANWIPPMNTLEKEKDPDGIWSKWSNRELAGDYQELFNRFDLLIMIKVPNMEHVYESRWLQETVLEKTIIDPELKKKIMTREEVYRFVMHYERLTRYILEEIPKFADIVIERDYVYNFSFTKIP